MLPQFKALREGKKLSLEEYFRLDENACNYGFEMLEQCNDPILGDLSSRLLDRRLFKFTDYSPRKVRRLSKVLKEKGYDPKYYLDEG